MMLYRLCRAVLFRLDPELAHHVAMTGLKFVAPLLKKQQQVQKPLDVFGLKFPNVIGLAAGLDKNAEYIDALFDLGFGFVEVGTVTPRPQSGNPKKRLFRIKAANAIINRMGFNNHGVDALVERLKARRSKGIVGVNIGKNKDTPNDKAFEDYLICMQKVYPYADYITVNISSPNTPGLRDLHAEDALDHLLQQLMDAREKLTEQHQIKRPLLVKVSPDLTDVELEVFLQILMKHQVDGIIATNTSVDHSPVAGLPHADEQGGLSGEPIAVKSRELVRHIVNETKGQLPVIGVGGITTVEAANDMLCSGATLIQLYTGLIYRGPGFVHQILNYISR